MNYNGQLAPPVSKGRGTRHISAPSQDTNASGIADSTISNGGESLVLSQFPTPPVSIPSTPIHTDFGSSIASGSPIRTTPATPLRVARRKPLPTPGPLQKTQAGQAPPSTTPASPAQSSSSQGQPISPYDWHDGASSIGMDATEDRLLSTSFITNLLQENKRARRLSNGSSAISGFSEMTYPPLASTVANRAIPSTSRTVASRPHGSRPPPTSFVPIPESPDPLMMAGDGDSETLYSQRDQPSIMRADLSPQPIGMAQAVLRNISPAPGNPLHHVSSSEALVPPPTVPIPRNRKVPSSNYQSRESVHSTKSAVSSFISRISGHPSVQRVIGWRKAKPLPPVPLIPHIPITAEAQHRREDENKPLPDLVQRADALHGLLEKGYHPHHSLRTFYASNKEHSQFDDDTILHHEATSGTYHSEYGSRSTPQPSITLSRIRETPIMRNIPQTKRRKMMFIGIGVVIVVTVIAIVVGVVVGKKKSTPSCPGNFVGASCNLDATCACTTQDLSCSPLAQNIIDLVPSLNSDFSLNLTTNQVYNQIWLVQGTTPNSCKKQGVLVDVGPNLRSDTQPKITQWAQTALLWAVVSSQDLTAVAKLQTFVQKAPWGSFNPSGDTTKFTTSALGYTFNFAAQTVTPSSASFTNLGQPSADQLSRVNSNAKATLDRMYSFAQAGSTLRANALQVYWTNVLNQNAGDLRTFASALTVSPILLPFDATSASIAKLLNSTSTTSFPPPLSCYPGLLKSQTDQITQVESSVFNIGTPPSQSQFDPSCFPDRPIYGILDVLRLRLPSPDPRAGVPRQAAVLKGAVSSRVLLRKGQTLSPLPGPSNVTNITSSLDPRDYGTLGLASHIILDYLSSMPSVDVARALVKYVLSSTSAQIPPPDNSSILYTSFSQIPALEVAVFGSVLPADIDHARSAFTTASGSLFFGTDQGTALRNWVISGCNSATAWAESIFSPKVVRDSSFSEPIFNATWTAAATGIRTNAQNVGVFNVTHSFDINNRFTVN